MIAESRLRQSVTLVATTRQTENHILTKTTIEAMDCERALRNKFQSCMKSLKSKREHAWS